MAFRVRQSGGFWNGVDGVITGWTWTNRSPGQSPRETEWVYGVPQILIDGKTQPETQHLFLGGLEEWEIGDHGASVRNRSGNNDPTATAAIFLGSLAEAAAAGGIDAKLPDTEAGEVLDMRGLIGLRVRLEQQVDERAKAKGLKRTSKRDASKTFDPTNTIVTKVYGRSGQQAASTATSAKAASTSMGAEDAAREIVVSLLAAAKDQTLTKQRIRVPVITETTKNPAYAPHRTEIQRLTSDDAFLASIDGVRYDRGANGGTLTLA